MDENWLEQQVRIAAETFASWPEWKRKAMREEMRRSFVYGNCAIENPAVTREMVDDVASLAEGDRV